MAKTIKTITPRDIELAINDVINMPLQYGHYRMIERAQAAKPGSITQTNRWIAAGREVFAYILMARHGITSFQALTKALRAGHDAEPDFKTINARAGELLKAQYGEN